MWRSKKLIIIAVLAAVVLVGSIGGIVLAQEENNENTQPGALFHTLWDKMATILQDEGVNITPEQLETAFTQAQKELRTEAMQNHLQTLVERGEITQEQADEFLSWQAARPDIPLRFGFRGMHGMRGFGGPCAPIE